MSIIRRAKIVCTIGPASESVEKLSLLLENGMNVARLNFSHGTHEEHAQRIINIREASKKTGIPIAVMLDTKGPEIRTGLLEDGKALLEAGRQIVLTTQEITGNCERIAVSYAGLPEDVSAGDMILIDDGLIALKVLEIKGNTEIVCEILNGGEISNRKGINVPNVDVKLPALTKKDVADIRFGIEQGIDFIAASFIRSATDVLEIRKILEDYNSDIHIISKIENNKGVKNIDEILKVSEGIMVARGDLGVEVPAEDVPLMQKMIIEKCNEAGKPVITATQMLDSMMRNPRPTRAEASDVANAILDGTDAIMLSGETAAGKYPVEAVSTMRRIAIKAETAIKYEEITERKTNLRDTTPDAISHATASMAEDLGASAIITATESGSTAKMVAKYRPKSVILAATPSRSVLRKLLLVWGITPLYAPRAEGTDAMIDKSIQVALQNGLINNGDLVVVTAGVPVGIPGTTNLIKVETVGKILAQGTGIGKGSVIGEIVSVANAEEAVKEVQEGCILVASQTDANYIPAVEKAAAVITEEAGLTSHAAIVCLSLGKPVIVGVKDAMQKLTSGTVVTMDITRGLIYRGETRVK